MQTPAPFDYERATSLEGAIASLKAHENSRIIAGGHSLLPMMKLRLATPSYLIDINDLTDLAYIREEGDELAIGALTRHVELLQSDELFARFPVFRDAEEVIADPVVRNRGTIGGSLCQADAAEDLSAVCSALHAKVKIHGADGDRIVPMSEFHIGPYMTAVKDGEILTEIRLPLKAGRRQRAREGRAARRRLGDRGRSAAVWLDGGKFADVGIGLSAVGPTTVELPRVQELLNGQAPSEELFEQAGAIASEDCSPIPDSRGPVDYKRHLAGVLTKRALRRATARALQQEA